MPFDIGFDFRNTSGYVTDPSYGVPVLAETYPHLYTAANGFSINAGIVAGPSTLSSNRDNTFDPRIAGINFVDPLSSEWVFRIDLASGSAPGAGTYTLDLAIGDPLAPRQYSIEVRDTSTVRLSVAGTADNTHHYLDATSALIAEGPTWLGTQVSNVSFSTTTVNVVMNPGGLLNQYHTLAHFRLIYTPDNLMGQAVM